MDVFHSVLDCYPTHIGTPLAPREAIPEQTSRIHFGLIDTQLRAMGGASHAEREKCERSSILDTNS
jgi:hypothetical protein